MRIVCGALISLLLASPSFAAPACSRDCLFDVMNEYLDAMIVRRDFRALKLTPDVKITENGVAIPPGEGLWKTAQAVTYKQIFADATTGQVGVHAVATEGGRPAIFAVRLRIVHGEISEIESVVARSGSASLFAPDELTTPNPLFEEAVAPERRTSREQMIAAANSYYDGIAHADGSIVAAAPGCYRVENGVEMEKIPASARAGHCSAGLNALSYIKPIRNRRYPLVDEERGLVWAIALLDVQASAPTLDKEGRVVRAGRDPRTILVCELFKISGGKLRRIDVVMRNIAFGAPSGWPDGTQGALGPG
jgi:hypothetical protein